MEIEYNEIQDEVVPSKNVKIINFPGIVINDEKAISFLGGLNTISKSLFANSTLSLNFKPEMKFSKSVKSNIKSTTSILLKSIQYRNKKTGKLKVVTEIIGPIYVAHEFKSLFDFDYLPFDYNSDDSLNVFYDKLIINRPMETMDSFISRDVPLYAPALNFSRYESPLCYKFAPRFRTELYIELEENTQKAPYHRKDRKSYAIFVDFQDQIPSEPMEKAMERIPSMLMQKQLEKAIELFNTRPIWSRSALIHHIPNISDNKLKAILPCCAYFMPGGPWARLWIRFGYDPKLEPEARKYQTVDVRIKPSTRMHFLFTEADSLKNSFNPLSKSLNADDRTDDEYNDDIDEKSKGVVKNDPSYTEKRFKFSRTSWPIAKQVHYQLVDIELDEVKKMIEAPPARRVCDPVDGWLPSNHQNEVRTLIMNSLKQWIILDGANKT